MSYQMKFIAKIKDCHDINEIYSICEYIDLCMEKMKYKQGIPCYWAISRDGNMLYLSKSYYKVNFEIFVNSFYNNEMLIKLDVVRVSEKKMFRDIAYEILGNESITLSDFRVGRIVKINHDAEMPKISGGQVQELMRGNIATIESVDRNGVSIRYYDKNCHEHFPMFNFDEVTPV